MLLGAVHGFGLPLFSPACCFLVPRRLTQETLPYSRFIAELDNGKIEEVTFQGSKVFGRFKDHRVFETVAPRSEVRAEMRVP